MDYYSRQPVGRSASLMYLKGIERIRWPLCSMPYASGCTRHWMRLMGNRLVARVPVLPLANFSIMVKSRIIAESIIGCDSINLVLTFYVVRTVYGFPLSYSYYALGTLSLVVFFMSTWEEYHTGTLYLGIVSGPVDGAVVLIVSSLISAFYGTFTNPRL